MKELLNDIVSYFGSRDYLLYYFKDKQGQTTITEYVNNTVDRLAQWLLDICYKPLDEHFINYNYLIGLRHTYEEKGKADKIETIPHIPARYMITCLFPITAVLKNYIAKKVEDPVLTDKLYHTWFKLQVLTTAFFLIPYTKEGRTKEDEENRKLLGEIISENMKDLLNDIVSYFGSRDYLLYYFKDKQGQTTITEYVNNTVDRLAQWLLDICYK
jgi:hypothetical protein